jgi:hypothetical protein
MVAGRMSLPQECGSHLCSGWLCNGKFSGYQVVAVLFSGLSSWSTLMHPWSHPWTMLRASFLSGSAREYLRNSVAPHCWELTGGWVSVSSSFRAFLIFQGFVTCGCRQCQAAVRARVWWHEHSKSVRIKTFHNWAAKTYQGCAGGTPLVFSVLAIPCSNVAPSKLWIALQVRYSGVTSTTCLAWVLARILSIFPALYVQNIGCFEILGRNVMISI